MFKKLKSLFTRPIEPIKDFLYEQAKWDQQLEEEVKSDLNKRIIEITETQMNELQTKGSTVVNGKIIINEGKFRASF